MFRRENSNFVMVLLQNSAWLILLCSVLCSASSKLEHFVNIFKEEYAPLIFDGVRAIETIYTVDVNEATDRCSEICYRSKYFCDLFIIMEITTGVHTCYSYNRKLSSFSADRLPEPMATRGIYRLYKPDLIEPLETRFSYDHKTSLDEWVTNLQTGYMLSEEDVPKDILAASVKAMNSKPATAIDFDKWVSSKDVSQSRRKSFELQNFTGWKIMEAVKAWQQFANGNTKTPPSEYSDTILLAFLDIFCPLLQEGITTIYDPVKKVVFITKKDLHVLVILYGPEDFAIVQSRDNFQSPRGDPFVLSNPHRQERNTPGNPVELFEQVMSKSFSNPFYKYYYGCKGITRLPSLLNFVVISLSVEYPVDLSSYHLSNPALIFYRDLITAVLSNVYKNEGHPIHTNLKTMLTSKDFGDISTIPKIE